MTVTKTSLYCTGDHEEEEEYNSEEEDLRLSAMKTLDLRKRIHKVERKVLETEDDELEEGEERGDKEGGKEGVRRKDKIKIREHKIEKLLKKQEMDRALYKAEKKAKKKEKIRLKSQVTAVLSKTDLSSKREARRLLSGRILEELPSASDYSDLDSPSEGERLKNHKVVQFFLFLDDSTMKVISKTDRGGTLQSDLAAVTSKTSAKMRLGDMGDMLEEDRGDLRARMMDKRTKIDRQSYAARVLGDLMGAETEARLGKKRRSDTWRDEDDEEAKGMLGRKRKSDTRSDDEGEEAPVKLKKKTSKDKKEKKSKDKKEKKEKKSKRSKRSHSPGEESPGSERNALQMAQEFSKEYEPIRSRKIKIKKTENQDDLGLSLDTSLETSRDEISRQEQSEKMSGDVMKDLDDFLND